MDSLVIADANFPSDSIASSTINKVPIRVHGLTSEILKDILTLFPLDMYSLTPVTVMDRVMDDKLKNLEVPAYAAIAVVTEKLTEELFYAERFFFYEEAKKSFVIVQTDDRSLYANVLISKGVVSKAIITMDTS